MLSAFSVKTWPGLAPKEYSIDTNVLLQVPRIESYLSRRTSPKRELPHDGQEGLRADTRGWSSGTKRTGKSPGFSSLLKGCRAWSTIRITMTKVGRSRWIT